MVNRLQRPLFLGKAFVVNKTRTSHYFLKLIFWYWNQINPMIAPTSFSFPFSLAIHGKYTKKYKREWKEKAFSFSLSLPSPLSLRRLDLGFCREKEEKEKATISFFPLPRQHRDYCTYILDSRNSSAQYVLTANRTYGRPRFKVNHCKNANQNWRIVFSLFFMLNLSHLIQTLLIFLLALAVTKNSTPEWIDM